MERRQRYAALEAERSDMPLPSRDAHEAHERHGSRAAETPIVTPATPLADLRFRALLGPDRWARLPPAVRRRFGKRLDDARTVTYTGHIVTCRMNAAGRALAQLLRVVGGPLPTSRDVGVPAAVVVTEDAATSGQFWTRIYGRRAGFPRVIGSSKRFRGPTGLEEYVGFGIGMALTISADERALRFHSDHYFLEAGGSRWRLPAWLTPGALVVSHVDRDAGRFEFVLELDHPLFGELVHQVALFADAPADRTDVHLPPLETVEAVEQPLPVGDARAMRHRRADRRAQGR